MKASLKAQGELQKDYKATDKVNKTNVTSEDPVKNVPIVSDQPDTNKDKVVLERRVGLFSAVALIVGTIIGSGIFVSPGQLLKRTGSVSVALLVWVASGLLSLLGALAYAELGTLMPRNGGEYVYFYESMKDLHPFFGPLPGFLYIWTSSILIKPSVIAIMGLIFAQYLLRPLWTEIYGIDWAKIDGDDCALIETWSTRIVAAAISYLVIFINCWSVEFAARIQNIITAAKVLVLGIIVVGGTVKLAQGNYGNLTLDFEKAEDFGPLAGAFYSGLWAYDSWNQLNYITEEIERPHVNLARAIMIAMPVCIILYLFVNIAYLSVLTPEELISSPAVAMDFGTRVIGNSAAWIMPLAVATSVFGVSNGMQFASARISYSAAKKQQLPDIIGMVNVDSQSPIPAHILNGAPALVMILVGNVGGLIDFFSFTSWICYGGCMIVLIVMRWTRKDAPRPYKVNIAIPIFVAIVSAWLVLWPIIEDPQMGYLYALCFIASGVFFYIPFVYYELAIPGMKKFTAASQKLLMLVPTEEGDDLESPVAKK